MRVHPAVFGALVMLSVASRNARAQEYDVRKTGRDSYSVRRVQPMDDPDRYVHRIVEDFRDHNRYEEWFTDPAKVCPDNAAAPPSEASLPHRISCDSVRRGLHSARLMLEEEKTRLEREIDAARIDAEHPSLDPEERQRNERIHKINHEFLTKRVATLTADLNHAEADAAGCETEAANRETAREAQRKSEAEAAEAKRAEAHDACLAKLQARVDERRRTAATRPLAQIAAIPENLRLPEEQARLVQSHGPNRTTASKKKAPNSAASGQISKAPALVAAPNADSRPATVKRDYGCPAAARRLIKRMWTCDVNASGFSEEGLCSTIDSSVIRYLSNIETCNELLTRMQLK